MSGKKPDSSDDLDALLAAAGRASGLLLPTTAEAVAVSEAALKESAVPVPDWVRDARTFEELLKKPAAKRRSVVPVDSAAAEGLAMAAREGTGKIPEDIAARMRSDREQTRKDTPAKPKPR